MRVGELRFADLSELSQPVKRAKTRPETDVADTVATGCPFCMRMMTDAMKANSLEETLEVRDRCELVAEASSVVTK